MVYATLRPGYGSPLSAYGGPIGYGIGGFFAQTENGRLVAVTNLIERARDFWKALFVSFPKLK